jgi:sugar/nucleoside kinase (ribokinase family)
MYDVICVGSATVDAFVGTGNNLFQKPCKNFCYVPFGSKILVEKLMFSTGGGGTNTAVGFSRQGFKVAYIGRVGLGTNSERIIRELEKEKVDTSLVIRKKGRTGFSVILDAKGHDRTILAFKGSNNEFRYSDISIKKLRTKWFYFSSMMEKAFQTLLKLAKYAKKNNIKVAFNPSSYLAVKGPKYLKLILDACEILVLNRGEAGELLSMPENTRIDTLLLGLYRLVPKLVVITCGKEGVYCYDGKTAYYQKARPIKAVETTGAGDAFACCFVSGIIKGKSIEYSLQMGAANAESVISHFGAKNRLLASRETIKFIKNNPRKIVKRKIAT